MSVETERKFLLKNDSWRSLVRERTLMRQGYICKNSDFTSVRVRQTDHAGYLTVKTPRQGISRLEFEYEIPVVDAALMLNLLCGKPLVEKYRNIVHANGFTWEIDEFLGENEGLIVAEVELPSADTAIALPDWIGEEVSADPRYFNSNLIKHPYKNWRE